MEGEGSPPHSSADPIPGELRECSPAPPSEPESPEPGPADPTATSDADPSSSKKRRPEAAPLTEAQRLLLKFSTPQPRARKGKEALPDHLQRQIERQKRKSEKETLGDTYSYTKKNKRARDTNVWQRMAVKATFESAKRQEERAKRPKAQQFIRPNVPSWLAP